VRRVLRMDTAFARELGRELARGRLAAGYPRQEDLARALQVSRSVVSRIESGNRVPKDDMLKAWCAACGLDYGHMASMTRSARASLPEWFEGWRDVESRSVRLAYWSPLIIAPPCRTESYVRHVLGASGIPPSDRQVAAQLARATALTHAEVTILLHELALLRMVGSSNVMHDQLEHVARLAELPSVHIHVIPNDCTVPGMSGAVNLALDQGVVHMDGLRGRTTSDPDVFQDAAVLFDRIRAYALPGDMSRESLLRTADQRWKP
jgi:transcriptional regulator with XRE-family HTH domain